MISINYEEIIQKIREQSIDYFTKLIKEMFSFWIEETDIGNVDAFPVIYIPLLFKGFKYEDDDTSLIFHTKAPILLNEYGLLYINNCEFHPETYTALLKELEENPLTLSFALCSQEKDHLLFQYEDLYIMIDFKLYYKIDDYGNVIFLNTEKIENPIRFKFLDDKNKDTNLL